MAGRTVRGRRARNTGNATSAMAAARARHGARRNARRNVATTSRGTSSSSRRSPLAPGRRTVSTRGTRRVTPQRHVRSSLAKASMNRPRFR
jgi:hypothetical protein